MLVYGPLTLTAGQQSQVNIGSYPDTQAIVIENESPYYLMCTIGGLGNIGVPALTADAYLVPTSFSGNVSISTVDYLSTATQAPSFVVFVKTFGLMDSLTMSLKNGGSTGYPISLGKLQSIGNSVNTTVTGNTLINDDNPPLTEVIEVSPQGTTGSSSQITPGTAPTGSTFFLDNSGNLTIRGFNNTSLVQFLQFLASTGAIQLGDTTTTTQMNGNVSFTNPINLETATIQDNGVPIVQTNSNDLILSPLTSGGVIAFTNSAQQVLFRMNYDGSLLLNTPIINATGNVNMINGGNGRDTIILPIVSGGVVGLANYGGTIGFRLNADGTVTAYNGVHLKTGQIFEIHTFTATGSGTVTVNHGLSSTPTDAWATTSASGSTQTVGVSGFTTTTVAVTLGSGLACRVTAYR
jgi:hypothetical protein